MQAASGASPVSSAAEEEARTLEHCVVIWHFVAGRVGTPETFLFVGTAMETGREQLGEQGTLRDWPRVPKHWEGQAGGLGRREEGSQQASRPGTPATFWALQLQEAVPHMCLWTPTQLLLSGHGTMLLSGVRDTPDTEKLCVVAP